MNNFSKKIISSVITGMLLFSTTAAFASGNTDYGTVNATILNVRQAPTTDSAIIGKLPNGSSVKIIGFENDVWYEISYYGQSGFVHSDYLINIRQTETDPSQKGNQVVNVAKNYIGVPYLYGGMSPAGFDCSGFTKYVYSQLGINLNRTAATQTENGYEVSRDMLQPGDLVFFATSDTGAISHTGIYVGNDEFIHSPRAGKSVEIVSLSNSYYSSRYVCARRIL